MIINDQNLRDPSQDAASDFARRTSNEVNKMSDTSKRAVSETADAVNEGLDTLRDNSMSALTRAAAKADEVSRKGVEQARRAGAVVSENAKVAGDRTVAYIRQEPVTAVLLAAGVGALLALLLCRRENSRYGRD